MKKDKTRSETRKIASNTLWLLAGRVVRLGSIFLAVSWTARYLGPEDFGVYSFAIAFVVLFSELGSLGLGGIVTHDLVEDPQSDTTILGTAFVLRLTGAIAIIAILSVLASTVPVPDSRARWLILLFAAGYLFRPTEVVNAFYSSRVEARFSIIATIAASSVLLGLTVSLVYSAAPLGWFIVARAAEFVVAGIAIIIVLAVHRPQTLRWQFNAEVAKQMLRRSWPLMASAITATIYLKVDQIMLGAMKGPEDVGIYAAASQLSEVWWFIPLMLMASLFPSLISLRRRDKPAYDERLGSIFAGLGWLGIVLAAFVAMSAPWLVGIVFGAGFEESATVLRIHVWAMPFLFMRAALSKWIIMEKVYIVSLITHGAGAITNIALNIALIPQFGPMGAAFATVVSYSVASFFSLFIYPGTRRVAGLMTRSVIFPRRHVAKLIGRRNR
jgi:O-antigen/teichoic acid export membrane protein